MRAILSLALVAAFAATAHARTVSYAVVVGNNAPPADATGQGLATLRYADDDAVRYYRMLSQFSRTTILSTLDDQTQKRHAKVAAVARVPSLETLRQVFASLGNDMRLDREAGNEPVLYFVFSGHGAIAEGGDAFLAVTDGRLTQKILFDELIGSLPTPRTHVIIDACHAAGLVGARGGTFFGTEATGTTAPVTEAETLAIAKNNVLERYPHVGVVTATTLGNETHEWSAIEAGVFSFEVLSGLAGPADVNGDRVVEYSELHAFVANANRSIANPRAVPMVVSNPPRADRRAPLVRLAEMRHSYLLQGNVGDWGRFEIVGEDGQRLVEAHVSHERPVSIALPKGTTVYVRTASGEARIASRGASVAVNDLRLTPPTVATRGGVDADYRQNLFASPYGPTYYLGFVDSQGGAPVQFDIDLRIRGELPMQDDQPRPLRRNGVSGWRVGGYAMLVPTLVLTTAAIVMGKEALREREWFNESRTRSEAYDHADDYREYSQSFWILTALAGGSGYLSYRMHKRASRTVRVAPTAPLTHSGPPGISFSGSF